MSIWLTEKNKTLIWKYHFYEHHYAKPDFAEYSKWCWRTTALPLFSTLPIVCKSIRIEPIPNLLSDYDILVGMTRVCRNVTNQVTLELVVEAMCLGYNYKKMHILTEKLWTCPSAGFSPHYFSCYFRLCTDGKKKNHTKHSKDENKLSMLNEHLFAVAAAAMAEAVSEAEVWLKLPISVPAARTVAEAVPEHQTPSAAQWAEELPEASWVTVEPVSGSNSRKENELWRRLNQKQSVKDKLGNPPTWFGSVWILCAFHLNGILGL